MNNTDFYLHQFITHTCFIILLWYILNSLQYVEMAWSREGKNDNAAVKFPTAPGDHLRYRIDTGNLVTDGEVYVAT